MSAALAGCLASFVVIALLVSLVRGSHRRRPASSAFRTGPLLAWCPTEGRETPHTLDAGVRRCRSCKTSTPTKTSGETHG
ncbi:hypothetical protein ACFPN0_14820 [Kitasatospora cinereorecta]